MTFKKVLMAVASLTVGLAGAEGSSAWTVESAGNAVALANADWRMTLDQNAKITGLSAVSEGGGGVVDLRAVKADTGYAVTGIEKYSVFKDLRVTEFYANEEFSVFKSQDFIGVTSLTLADFSLSCCKAISHRCFKGCTALAEVKLPPELEEIAGEAFQGCTALRKVEPMLPETVRAVGDRAFSKAAIAGRITIPEGVEKIAEICKECPNLEEVELADSIKEMASAFDMCTSLTNIAGGKLPSAATNAAAFRGCSALSMDLLDMSGCTNLLEVGGFSNVRIVRIVLPPRVRKICEKAFQDACIGEVAASDPGRWKGEMRRTDGVVGNLAFYRNSVGEGTLTRIEFPWGGTTAFEGSGWFQAMNTLSDVVFFGKAFTAPGYVFNKASNGNGRITIFASRKMDREGWEALSSPLDGQDAAPSGAFGVYSHSSLEATPWVKPPWMVWGSSPLEVQQGIAIVVK